MTTSLLLHHSILEIPMESDGQLIARIERQDKEALEKLYDRHADKSRDWRSKSFKTMRWQNK